MDRDEHWDSTQCSGLLRELLLNSLNSVFRFSYLSVSGSGMWLNAICSPPRSRALCALAKYTACLPKRAFNLSSVEYRLFERPSEANSDPVWRASGTRSEYAMPILRMVRCRHGRVAHRLP